MKVDHNPENITIVLKPWQAALIKILMGKITSNLPEVNDLTSELYQHLKEIFINGVDLNLVHSREQGMNVLKIIYPEESFECFVDVNPDGSGLIYVNITP